MRMIFVNLPVKDLAASRRFYETLGFTNNPQFTDETAACMVISDAIFVMLLTHEKFRSFIKNEIATPETTEVLMALSSDSREAVDQMVEAALANGGQAWREPQDHGWMYERSFRDPDGHVWETMWMDAAAAAGGPPAE